MHEHQHTAVSMLPIHTISSKAREDFFVNQWGSTEMIVSSGVYHCLELDGYASVTSDRFINGMITFVTRLPESICEIISLDSLQKGKGIGSQLLIESEQTAMLAGCREMRMITTNDNLEALRFYQKRGYRLTAVYPDAVHQARLRKPSIPLVAENGIPIRDELLLSKLL
ncbi:GNAT family N-acetyltransferase [Paenibacillus dauci]|uniref:GNAT family N-acetyltransferase n=1 Tax=Paenibacillus dauci TaxID=1567106 RepID=UPI0018CF2758|nr:GNAT family N-acetyltransferase [Paenibacillus dauci]